MNDIWIPGKPVAQGRVRFARRGKFTTAYDPKDSANYKNWVKCCLIDAGVKMYDKSVPLFFSLIVYVLRPPSVSVKKRPHCTAKPDLDNYIKILSDACHGFIFEDQQIVRISARTVYVEDLEKQGVLLKVEEYKI